MKPKIEHIVYLLIFALGALLTLNFNYVEGDDARTIVFHVLGRDANIQPQYSAYHSMFDAVFSLFTTQDETVLRVLGVLVSYISGVVILICLANIAGVYFKRNKSLIVVLCALPFIIPEMLFSSLIVNPTLIGFAFILISHLCLIHYKTSNKTVLLIASILCFGLGTSFRWSLGFYLFVLFGEFVLNTTNTYKQLLSISNLKRSVFIFPFFIISVFVSIYISGYSLMDIVNVYSESVDYVGEKEHSLMVLGASSLSLFTPALLLLTCLGIVYGIKYKNLKLLGLFIFSVLPYFSIGLVPVYKYMITVLPPLVLIVIYGFINTKSRVFKTVIGLAVILPWILGFQLNTNSAWGPGFEISKKAIKKSESLDFNPDKSTEIKSVKPVLGSGMAMPTPEGPRPIYGYLKVFLTDWNAFVEAFNQERLEAVNYALENDINILQDVNHSYVHTKLAESGYTTSQAFKQPSVFGVHRAFYKNNDTLFVDVFKSKNDIFKSKIIRDYMFQNHAVVVYSSYSNIITKLTTKYPDMFEQKGPYWGVLKQNN